MKTNNAINLPLLLLLLASFINHSLAQNSLFLGARSFALANSSSTISDEFSLNNNPGSLGYVEEGSISFGYLNPYNVEGLNSIFASISKSLKHGCASIGLFRFGDETFQQSKLMMGFGNNFGIASLGASINYNHYLVEGFGSHGFISLDIGGLAKLSPSVLISGSIKNVTQARMSRSTGEYLPTIMSVGISFLSSDQLALYSQYDKNLQYPGQLNFGLEYTYSVLILRAGLCTDPSVLSFGIGLNHKKIKIDYGIRNHQVLSASHCFTVSFHFHDVQQGN